MHCLTAVYNEEYWANKCRNSKSDHPHRAMWRHSQSITKKDIERGYETSWHNVTQGFYLFGGADGQGFPCNDLWIIEPDYELN
jgi:hypothetical protein